MNKFIEINPEIYQDWVINWYNLKHKTKISSLEEIETVEDTDELFVDFDTENGLKFIQRFYRKPNNVDVSLYQVYSPLFDKDLFEIVNVKKFTFALLKNQELAQIYEQHTSDAI